MSEANKIKKVLYLEKPVAIRMVVTQEGMKYQTNCSLGKINFFIPREDYGDGGFNDEEPAQLLIRWLAKNES